MDINDVYYDKYIKYKTKYLELKEQSGNGRFSNMFTSNKEKYGYYYDDFVLEINKIKVIKEIKKVIGVEGIKEMMKINTLTNKSIYDEFNNHYNKLLKNIFENEDNNKKIIQIIRKSKRNDLKIKHIITVLEDIEDILIFNTYPPKLILPELYVKFLEKLHTLEKKPIEEVKKKKKKELEKELEAEIKKQYKEITDNIAETEAEARKKRIKEKIEKIKKQNHFINESNNKFKDIIDITEKENKINEEAEKIAEVLENVEDVNRKTSKEIKKEEEELLNINKEIRIQLTRAQELKLELQIGEIGNKEKDEYKQNIESIKNIYLIFCKIKNGYQDYYNDYYSKINNYNDYYSIINDQNKKNAINIINEEYKKELIINVNNIIPKVPLLLEAIDLYFDFLKYYIINDIKPYTFFSNIDTINKPFQLNKYIIDQNHFLYYIGYNGTLPRSVMINKIFEKYLYSDRVFVLLNQINSLKDFEYMKNLLVNTLNDTKDNILNIISKNNHIDGYFEQFMKIFGSQNDNPFDKIIIIINDNYNNINIKSNNTITWEIYHKKYQNEIDNILKYNNFNFPLLKKCINIYLYKIFNHILSQN